MISTNVLLCLLILLYPQSFCLSSISKYCFDVKLTYKHRYQMSKSIVINITAIFELSEKLSTLFLKKDTLLRSPLFLSNAVFIPSNPQCRQLAISFPNNNFHKKLALNPHPPQVCKLQLLISTAMLGIKAASPEQEPCS